MLTVSVVLLSRSRASSLPSISTETISAATARLAPQNIRFVRVTTQSVTSTMLFSSAALGGSKTQTGQSIAGMSVGVNSICDFFPVAVALTDINPAPNTTMTLTFTQG